MVMDEEIEHHRFAVRDLAVLEAGETINRKLESTGQPGLGLA